MVREVFCGNNFSIIPLPPLTILYEFFIKGWKNESTDEKDITSLISRYL